MDKRILVVDELEVLDAMHARIVATGDIIPSFAGGLGGGGGGSPPEPSPEERQAYAKQAQAYDLYLETSRKQSATADALEPYLYKQLGLQKTQVQGEREANIARLQEQLKTIPTTVTVSTPARPGANQGPQFAGDRSGFYSPGTPAGTQTIVNPAYAQLQQELQAWQAKPQTYSIDELPPDATELQRREIQTLANQREIAALKGDLPVDPSVEADINRGEAQMREELARRGVKPGSGDIYNRAISEYQRGANALRYGVRHGEMTTADAIATGRQLELQRKQGQYIDQATGQTRAGADMLATGGSLYGSVADRYAGQRFKTHDYRVQEGMAAAGGANDLIGAGVGAAGMIGGAAAMSSMAAPATIGTAAFFI